MQKDGNEIVACALLLWLHRKLVFWCTVLPTIAAVVISLLLPEIYASTARILPPKPESPALGELLGDLDSVASLAGIDVAAGNSAELYLGMLKSRTVADGIIEKHDLMRRYELDYREDAYKALRGRVLFQVGRKDGIISIRAEDEDPTVAANIANSFVCMLVKLNTRLELDSATIQRKFLKSRMEVIEAELLAAEEELFKYQSDTHTVKVDAQADSVIEIITKLMKDLIEREVQLGALALFRNDNSVNAEVLRKEIELLTRRIQALQEPDANHSDGVVMHTKDIPRRGMEYAKRFRELKIKEGLYEFLTKRYELAKLQEANVRPQIQVLDVAAPADKKIRPKRAYIVIGACFVSFFLASCFVLFRESLRAVLASTEA